MERVVVAMSGGVDSAVAAGLLVEQGYEVVGITMQIWPEGSAAPATARGCCSIDAVEDARRASQALAIPHYVLNMRQDFDRTVIQDFVEEYRRGRTPNPCVACNKHIKFDALLERAEELGARWIATGHYARTAFDEASRRWKLLRSVDHAKDQSYVLYPLSQQQLSRAMFPLGSWTKTQTRERALAMGLKLALKPDSQEICFVPDRDYGRFLEAAAPDVVAPGSILDTAGRVLGQHRGVAFYTVGQRKGIGLTSTAPLYITEIDPERNVIVVGDDSEVYRRECLLEQVNWVSVGPPAAPVAVKARIRYNMREAPAELAPLPGGGWRLRFEEPQRAITPGQSAVFYRGDEVLGGGLIDAAPNDELRVMS